MYNGRTNLVEHVSHFNQKMVMHSKNESLMCKVFLSSLGPVAMRWFEGLGAGSIGSFKELTQAFGHALLHAARFLSLKFLVIPVHERRGDPENIFRQILGDVNEIDGDFNNVVISTFKVGLPTEHGLRKSLTGKPVTIVQQLMDRIDKYKTVEEDQQ